VRALLLGDRIDISGLDPTEVLSIAPLAFRVGHDGVVTVFRYGVVVLFGLSSQEEDEVLRTLRDRVMRPIELPEEETATKLLGCTNLAGVLSRQLIQPDGPGTLSHRLQIFPVQWWSAGT
jgi:hypothetical protein